MCVPNNPKKKQLPQNIQKKNALRRRMIRKKRKISIKRFIRNEVHMLWEVESDIIYEMCTLNNSVYK